MTTTLISVENLPSNPALQSAITVGDVTINPGSTGNPSVAVVKPEDLRQAILYTLSSHGYYTSKINAKYELSANLSRLDQETFGFRLSALASVKYVLLEVATKKRIYDDTISIPYTADMSDAFDATQRARIATGRALSENFNHLMRILARTKINAESSKGTHEK